jgi:hypothetical protein
MVLLLAKIRPTIEGTVVSETVSASANHLLLKVFFDPESGLPLRQTTPLRGLLSGNPLSCD